ncbi:MAG: permease [Thermoplasmata archaeon]
MTVADYIGSLLWAGVQGLLNYLSAHVLLCLVPAFFIAGALSALFKKEAVTRYLGPDTPKHISYPVASAAGLLIAVCSCTILPLFAGIWKKGAGLGPAVTFLFTGPAINLLAITYTGSLVGWDIAGARAILSIGFGILIGVLMGLIFGNVSSSSPNAGIPSSPTATPSSAAADSHDPSGRKSERQPLRKRLVQRRSSVLFVLLIGVLLSGTFPAPLIYRIPILAAFILLAAVWALRVNSREENRAWMGETYFFVRMIVPLLLVGVFIAGVASALIPSEVVGKHLGRNTLSANAIAVAFGIFMYFPTLVEVPVARMFLDLGMAKGPLLAYLLADPELSFQSVLVTRRIIGTRMIAVYVALVAVFCTAAGMMFGVFVG